MIRAFLKDWVNVYCITRFWDDLHPCMFNERFCLIVHVGIICYNIVGRRIIPNYRFWEVFYLNNYVFRDNIENELQKLIDNKGVTKKLVCLYGIEKIGKTFTLEYIRKEMLQNSLAMSLKLSTNNISNPVFLKTSIFNLLRDTSMNREKNFDLKELIKEMFKGFKFTLPIGEYDAIPLVDIIEKTMSDYESQIKLSLDKDKLYVEKLSDVVSYVSKRCDRMLYVLIDDIHHADIQIWAFLDILLLKRISLGLFITYDRNCSHDARKKIDELGRVATI